MREDTQATLFTQTGLANTEIEILDSQQRCDMTGALNAIPCASAGVGLPTDKRWEWTHELLLYSIMFGDAMAAEWHVLLYTSNMTDLQGDQTYRARAETSSRRRLEWKGSSM